MKILVVKKYQGPGALRSFPESVWNEEQGMQGSISVMLTRNIAFVKCRVIAARASAGKGRCC
jgi:hypothetical protein